MKIDSIKEFEKLVKSCRKLGVDAMEIGEIKFNLGPMPKVGRQVPKVGNSEFPEENIPVPKFNGILVNTDDDTIPVTNEVAAQDRIESPDDLTEEQKMFLSSDPLIAEQVMG